MVPFIIDIEQSYFGGVFKRDVLIPVLKDLKEHNLPQAIFKFIHLLIRECSHSIISSFEELYKKLGFNDVNQYREFLNLMLSHGRVIREHNQAKSNSKVKVNRFDLQYLAESYLDYLDEFKVS